MDDEIIVGLPGRTIYQAKAELYFPFAALAVESHFMPAFSQADWLLGLGAVKPTARMRARIVTNLSWRVSFDSVEGRGEGGFEYQAMRHRRRNGGQKELLQHRPLSNRRLSGLVRSPAFGSIGDHPLNI